tara:strand:+ start:79 stop:306 length:228 start_codon:yes stop_codon:yes gene_type:complete
MEINPELLKRMMTESAEFKRLYEEHTKLKFKVDELNRSRFLTSEEELEKKKHQKQKLLLKDKIEGLLGQTQINLH